MRSTIIICLAIAAFCSGCAYEGVIIEKRFRPLPFPDSLGVNGMYNFQLRDGAGQIHSQMVTPDVFSCYKVGDYFNDLQPCPTRTGKDFKPIPLAPVEMNSVPYQPVKTTRVRREQQTGKAAKAHHKKKYDGEATNSHRRVKYRAKTAKTKHRVKHEVKVVKQEKRAKHGVKTVKTKHHRKVGQKHRTPNRVTPSPGTTLVKTEQLSRSAPLEITD